MIGKSAFNEIYQPTFFASLVLRKISKPNRISSFYGKFVYKRKALRLFRSINGFLQRTLRLGQSNFHLASIFPQNLMYRGWRKNSFVKKQIQESAGWCVWAITTCCHDLHDPKHLGLTAQWVSAALQREDQTCTRTWRTWPKFSDFSDLPPHLKGAKIRLIDWLID